MKQIAVFVCLVLCLAATSASAQAIRNPGFDTDLNHWQTFYASDYSGLTPGTAIWVSSYGGSARLDVDGAPGVIGMCQPTCSTLYAGDSAWMDVTVTDMQGFAGLTFVLGDKIDDGNGQTVLLNGPAPGDYHLRIVANKTYPQGTFYGFWLSAWPGAATCWVKRADAPVLEEDLHKSLMIRPTMEVNPNPATGRTKVSFSTPQLCTGRLAVYNAAGSLVRGIEQRHYGVGQHSAVWNGRDDSGHSVSPGTYFIRLNTADGREETAPVVVTR